MAGTPIGRRIHLRLYLEGQRVPIQQVSLSGSVNGHVQASIQIPPVPLATKIKPRTLVHVLTKRSNDDDFRLLFEGEYLGYQDMSGSKSKFFVLSCVGLTHFWDTVFQFFIDRTTPAAMGRFELASFVSGTAQKSGEAMSSVNIALRREVFSGYVEQSLVRNGNDIQQAMLDVLFLMANVTGEFNGNIENPRINSQVEKAFINLRLGERVFVLPDEEIKDLINLKNAEALVKQIVGNIPDFTTIAGILSLFLGHIYYDWVPMVGPSYTPRDTTGEYDFFRPLDSLRGPVAPSALPSVLAAGRSTLSAAAADPGNTQTNRTLTKDKVMRDVIFKPKTHYMPAPSCNLIFPSMYDNFTAARNFMQEPTRMRIRVQSLPGNKVERALSSGSYYAPPDIDKALGRERRTSPVDDKTPNNTPGVQSNTGELISGVGGQPINPGRAVKRHETLIIQTTFSGEIDETLTGIIPAFEEMGFAEYGQAVKRGAGAGSTPSNSTPAIASQAGTTVEAAAADAEAVVEAAREALEKTKAAAKAAADATDAAVVGSEDGAAGADAKIEAERAKDTDRPIDSTIPRDTHVYFTNMAQYKLDLARSAARSVQALSGPYNENLALGFPAVVFGRTAIYAGDIMNINQVVTKGQASTNVTLGFVRELSLLPGIHIGYVSELKILEKSLLELASADSVTLSVFQSIVARNFTKAKVKKSKKRIGVLTNGFDPIDRLPARPAWISARYDPENIAASVYQKFLGPGVKSTLELANMPALSSLPQPQNVNSAATNQVIAANILFIRYTLNSNKVSFVDKMTKRPVATGSEAMSEFLGFGTPAPVSKDAPRSADLVRESLTEGMTLGRSIDTVKDNAVDPVVDPYVPVIKVRVGAVKEYLDVLSASKAKAFKG